MRPMLEPSWAEVGAKWVPSWAEVGAPSCGHVGSKWRIWMMLRRYATCANYQQSSALFGSSYGCLPQLKLAPVEQICSQRPLLNTTPRHPAPDYYPQKDAIKVIDIPLLWDWMSAKSTGWWWWFKTRFDTPCLIILVGHWPTPNCEHRQISPDHLFLILPPRNLAKAVFAFQG